MATKLCRVCGVIEQNNVLQSWIVNINVHGIRESICNCCFHWYHGFKLRYFANRNIDIHTPEQIDRIEETTRRNFEKAFQTLKERNKK